eukprot:TRINITY_DN7936_c0_g1_i1.p1 TRINITY_DN7936_c0_g1~~TRINITY_DN7936_c0_g1_i1.p1  ORF type:complete len:207 (-),score=42.45 TRINITY_DN7936_c0_g1_i1:27-647(-)
MVVTVTIVSDLSCPWCFVGKRRFDAALAQLTAEQRAEVQVTYHPYMIDTSLPAEGMDYLEYNRKRWGGDGWVSDLRRSARPDGINFADWRHWANSLHGHRLMEYAKQWPGKQSEAKEALFQHYYEQGENISLRNVVAAIGEELGLPGVRDYITSDEGTEGVLRLDRAAKRELHVYGVPLFIVNGRDRLSGVQPTQEFLAVLRRHLA